MVLAKIKEDSSFDYSYKIHCEQEHFCANGTGQASLQALCLAESKESFETGQVF